MGRDVSGGRRSAGIADVAALAGVSVGTVSNVLNHPHRVAEATLRKVEDAMSRLDYVPNSLARSLVTGSNGTIGLIVTDLHNSLFVDIAHGAELEASGNGSNLLMANADARLDWESRYLDVFSQQRVAGILLTLNDDAHFTALVRRLPTRTPVVLLNYRADPTSFCSVSVDNELGGYLGTRHLIEQGRRRLVMVSGPEELEPVADRVRGFRRAATEFGLGPCREVVPEWINRADGWKVGNALVPAIRAGEVDGIFACSDLLAAGILHALAAEPEISVPADVAVVGYDNNQAAWDSPIPITTVAQPGEEVGRLGAALVREEVDAARGTHEHRMLVRPPHLVVRKSSWASSS